MNCTSLTSRSVGNPDGAGPLPRLRQRSGELFGRGEHIDNATHRHADDRWKNADGHAGRCLHLYSLANDPLDLRRGRDALLDSDHHGRLCLDRDEQCLLDLGDERRCRER